MNRKNNHVVEAISCGVSNNLESKFETGIIKKITVEHIFENPNEPKYDELLEDRVTIETIILVPAKKKKTKKDEIEFETNLVQNLIEKIYRDKEIAFTEIKAYDNEGKPVANKFWQNALDSKYEMEEIIVRRVNEDDKEIVKEFTEKEIEENYLIFQKLKIVGVPKEIEKVIKKYSLLEDVILYNAPKEFTGKNWERYKLLKYKFNGIYYRTSHIPKEMENLQRPCFSKDSVLKDIVAENLLEIEKEEILKFLEKTLQRKYEENKIKKIMRDDFNKLIKLFLFELRQQIIKDVLRNPELGWDSFDWRISFDRSNNIRVYDIFNKNGERIYDFTFSLSSNVPIKNWLVRKFSYFFEEPSKASLFETMSGYGRNFAIRCLFDYFSLLNKPFGMSLP
ncbi:MAG: hypothetical protein QXK80_00330 [Candidatus Pacearchaeota archaeon]